MPYCLNIEHFEFVSLRSDTGTEPSLPEGRGEARGARSCVSVEALPVLGASPAVSPDTTSLCGKKIRQGTAGLDSSPEMAHTPLTNDVDCKLVVMASGKPPQSHCSRFSESSPKHSMTAACRKPGREAGGEELMFRKGEWKRWHLGEFFILYVCVLLVRLERHLGNSH